MVRLQPTPKIMDIQPEFSKRDFSVPLAFPNVHFAVQRYGYIAGGGADQAAVKASGTADDLWPLLNWLRAPVTLIDGNATQRWWGYLHALTLRSGAIQVGVSLDTMFNRVNVVYSYIEPGSSAVGTRANTGWAQHDLSVSTYGTRELLHSLSGDTPQSAEQARAVVLAALKLPQPVLTPSYGQSALSAELALRGWWHTLGWTYFSRTALAEHLTDVTADDQNLGAASGNQQVAQSFQISEAWDAYSIKVKLRTEGSPSDNVRVRLCTDASGTPGTVLDSATVAASAIGSSLNWVIFTLNAPEALRASTTYWIVVNRSGGVDGTNYYVVAVDESLSYTRGVFRLYNGTSWGTRSPDADMLFQVTGVEETTVQLVQMVDDEGQFLEGVDVQNESGVYTSPYRDGDRTTQAEITALLQRGTTNGRRLLAEVTASRRLRVYEEPERSANTIVVRMDMNGVLYDRWDNDWPGTVSPVGKWCQLRDWPDTVDQNLLADPAVFFIESAEFDVARQAWVNVTPRGAPSPWELGQIAQG